MVNQGIKENKRKRNKFKHISKNNKLQKSKYFYEMQNKKKLRAYTEKDK